MSANRPPRPPRPKLFAGRNRSRWRDRVVQAIFSLVVWWAVYWRVAAQYGPGGGVIAATCAAWLYVLVTAYAAYLLEQREPGANRPGGSAGGGGRWPGASP